MIKQYTQERADEILAGWRAFVRNRMTKVRDVARSRIFSKMAGVEIVKASEDLAAEASRLVMLFGIDRDALEAAMKEEIEGA